MRLLSRIGRVSAGVVATAALVLGWQTPSPAQYATRPQPYVTYSPYSRYVPRTAWPNYSYPAYSARGYSRPYSGWGSRRASHRSWPTGRGVPVAKPWVPPR